MTSFGDVHYEKELEWREKALGGAKAARLTAEAEAEMAARTAEAAMQRAAFYRGEEELHRKKLLTHIGVGWSARPEYMKSRLLKGEGNE